MRERHGGGTKKKEDEEEAAGARGTSNAPGNERLVSRPQLIVQSKRNNVLRVNKQETGRIL